MYQGNHTVIPFLSLFLDFSLWHFFFFPVLTQHFISGIQEREKDSTEI